MTSTRANRPSLPSEVAQDEIRTWGGSQFDPELVAPFPAAVRKNKGLQPLPGGDEKVPGTPVQGRC